MQLSGQASVLLLATLGIGTAACAAEIPAEKKPLLRFDAQGPFKIVQFTALHLKEDSENDGRTIALMEQGLDVEKPE